MASPIQLFRSVRRYFQLLGIDQSQPSETFSINWRIVFTIFWCAQHSITIFAFFIIEAKTVIEYGISFYGFIIMAYCVYYFSILIWQRSRIFQLIENFQQFIEQSKCSKIEFGIRKEIFAKFFISILTFCARRGLKDYAQRTE